jgi:hypothetical protein
MIYFASEFCIIFMTINFVLSQAWLRHLLLSWLSLPTVLLAFTCTEREYFSCIQLLKTKLFQWVHYKFLCMVFQTIPCKFSCAIFQNLQNTSHFVTLFLAHEDVVVGIVIFHTKLSTPRLACFICSSLILQDSWSYHCNLNKKIKKGTPPWYVKVGGHPMDSVSHGLWKEKWGRVPSFIKEHVCANFSRNSKPFSTCLVWKIARTTLPVVDKNNHLSKHFFISIWQMKSSRTC